MLSFTNMCQVMAAELDVVIDGGEPPRHGDSM